MSGKARRVTAFTPLLDKVTDLEEQEQAARERGDTEAADQLSAEANELVRLYVEARAPDVWARLHSVDIFSAEWLAFVKHYRKVQRGTHGDGPKRPGVLAVATAMGISDRTLSDRLHDLGIRNYNAVHALIDALDPGA